MYERLTVTTSYRKSVEYVLVIAYVTDRVLVMVYVSYPEEV